MDFWELIGHLSKVVLTAWITEYKSRTCHSLVLSVVTVSQILPRRNVACAMMSVICRLSRSQHCVGFGTRRVLHVTSEWLASSTGFFFWSEKEISKAGDREHHCTSLRAGDTADEFTKVLSVPRSTGSIWTFINIICSHMKHLSWHTHLNTQVTGCYIHFEDGPSERMWQWFWRETGEGECQFTEIVQTSLSYNTILWFFPAH
jgi:hypothetical protein